MTPETRNRIVELSDQRKALMEELIKHPMGLAWCERHTLIADEVVRILVLDATSKYENLPPLAVIATGGYGRREMAPYSDIDITVVPGDEASPNLDDVIRTLFQDLHWAFCTEMRLDVGYAYRLLSDAPGLDAKTRTGLLDMRLISGSTELFHALELALVQTFTAGEFILSKIQERQESYERYHDTPYVVEPHLKEGAGGTRDFHCANWLSEAIGERAARPSKAYDTLFRYRNVLHSLSGKQQDLLSRHRQGEIADTLGVDPYVMMQEVVQAAADVHAWYVRAKEKLHEARIPLAPGAWAVQGEVRLLPDADAGEAAVGVAIATKLGLAVSDMPLPTCSSVSGPAAIYAVSQGERTIRNLDRAGLLSKLLPELTKCRSLVPQDPVHTYTVFEHTLRVVRNLDSLDQGTFLGDLKESLNDRAPLYLAALLHDVGKVQPEEDHSLLGAEMSRAVTKRWGLADGVAEDVAWLIQEHLTMSRFIRIRDIQHPDTIEEFAETVTDVRRLVMLTLLTWADIEAVGPGAWTPAQDTFLRQLFQRTQMRLQGEFTTAPDAVQSRQRLLRQLRGKPEDQEKVRSFVESLPSYYLASTPPEVVRLHLDFFERANTGEIPIELFNRPEIGSTDYTVCALDQKALLSRILGVFYAYDLSLLGIRACTTDTTPGVALDVFTVSFGGRPVPPATSQHVLRALQDVVQGVKTVEEILTTRGKDPLRHQELFTHTYVPGLPGILEVRAPRGRGMPFRMSRQLAEKGCNIVAARVGQWAGSAAGSFYITGPNGRELTTEEVTEILF